MNTPTPLVTPLAGPFPPPIFTVGSALSWLGHECLGRGCSRAIEHLRASVWFVRRGERFQTSPPETLVLVDPAAGVGLELVRLRGLIDAVDRCTRADGIRVHDQRLLNLRCGDLAGRPTPPPTAGAFPW